MIKACVFDAFGTLFNLDSSILADIDHPKLKDILSYAREKQLSYTWLRSLMKRYIPFDEITKIALQDGCKKYGVEVGMVEEIIPLYFEPTVFEDVMPTLAKINKTQIDTAILSNGTFAMLESGITKNEIGHFIDHVFSVDDIKIFKPDPAAYSMVTAQLKLSPEEVLFVSSNQWDVTGAASFGFNVAWVNRNDVFRESVTITPNVQEVSSLTKLIDII